MSLWKPQHLSVVELASVLKNALSISQSDRADAMESLETLKLQPEFLNYLCYILVSTDEELDLGKVLSNSDIQSCRAAAGMMLKNTILENHGGSQYDYVKSNIMKGLFIDKPLLSNITGIVITSLFSSVYRQNRNDPTSIQILSELLELISKGNEAGAKALSKIVEDNATFLQLEWANSVRPMEILVNKLLEFMLSESNVIRAEAVKSLNTLIPLESQSMLTRLDDFLQNIFVLAQNDGHGSVRIQVCHALTILLEQRPDKIIVQLPGIVHFMLHIIQTVSEEKVSLQACEFLLSLANSREMPRDVMQPYLKDLVPTLLTKMVHDEDEILILEASNDDDANLEDKDEEIRPSTARTSNKRDTPANDDDYEDEEDGGADEVDSHWNVRKCAAATLDSVTNTLPKNVLSIALPLLRDHLVAEKWYIREATILALGAMAEGGMNYFTDQLPALIPFLVEKLQDPWAPVRTITCWTLGRFSPWILNDNTQFLIPVMEPILQALMDMKKSVQEAAISSVAVFIENCDGELLETLLYNELLVKFSECFQLYQKKNLIILYDAVGRLAEKCEFDESAIDLILPHLIQKWTSLADNDKELWPLLECLSYVAASLGVKFLPMAPDVYSRAWRILCQAVDLETRSQVDPTIEVLDKDFMVTSLDLIDGLVQGLGSQSQALLFPHGDRAMFQVMLQCLKDHLPEVRQSCFALLGDIAYLYDPRLLQQESPLVEFLQSISVEIVHASDDGNRDDSATASMNNAIWALGLISERLDLSEFIIDLSRIMLDIFTDRRSHYNGSVLENVAITIGRMALFHPEVFATGQFASDTVWSLYCSRAMRLEDPDEKTAAFRGFVKIVNLTDATVQISNATLHKLVKGLATDVDITDFSDDLYGLFFKNLAALQSIKFNDDELSFLQQFT